MLRLLLAGAAFACAALPLGAAHAGPESCTYVTSAPRFVYYNPEMGFYYVDTTAAAWVSGQPGSASAYAACVAGSLPRADGCLGEYLSAGYPAGGDVVTIDGQGRVIVDPHGADPFVGAVVGNAAAFVDCVV